MQISTERIDTDTEESKPAENATTGKLIITEKEEQTITANDVTIRDLQCRYSSSIILHHTATFRAADSVP